MTYFRCFKTNICDCERYCYSQIFPPQFCCINRSMLSVCIFPHKVPRTYPHFPKLHNFRTQELEDVPSTKWPSGSGWWTDARNARTSSCWTTTWHARPNGGPARSIPGTNTIRITNVTLGSIDADQGTATSIPSTNGRQSWTSRPARASTNTWTDPRSNTRLRQTPSYARSNARTNASNDRPTSRTDAWPGRYTTPASTTSERRRRYELTDEPWT